MLINARALPGRSLRECIVEAVELCKVAVHPDVPTPFELSRNFRDFVFMKGDTEVPTVRFRYNGVTVIVQADSNPELIIRAYQRVLRGTSSEQAVGPHPERTSAPAERTL